MNSSFGPWSTAINTGAKQELNTFWKRRLAMLPTLSQSGTRATRRTLVILAVLGIGALALPTLKRGTHAQTVVLTDSADEPERAIESSRPESAGERRDKPANDTKSGNAAPLVEYLPRPTKAEERILEALAMPVDIVFRGKPLEECLQTINDYPGLPKFQTYIERTTLADEGVALDQPVTLMLKGCRVESALRLLLDPVQLTCVIENDVLLVTTAAKAGEKLITRTYPVRDLFQGRVAQPAVLEKSDGTQEPVSVWRGATRHDDLVDAIIANIQPDSWEELSGPGSLTYVKESGSLVIRQTFPVHREILQLLRDLREAKRLGLFAPERTARQPGTAIVPKFRRDEALSIIGIMDLDGDGQAQPGAFREWVGAAGGTIDNEVDDTGVLRINGKVRITPGTKFVVIGKIPELASAKNPEEVERIQKMINLKNDLTNQARQSGVRVVSLREFLDYIGYKPNSRPAVEEETPSTTKKR